VGNDRVRIWSCQGPTTVGHRGDWRKVSRAADRPKGARGAGGGTTRNKINGTITLSHDSAVHKKSRCR
jgi:hypothetical protein